MNTIQYQPSWKPILIIHTFKVILRRKRNQIINKLNQTTENGPLVTNNQIFRFQRDDLD